MAAKTGESLPRKDKDFLKKMSLDERRDWIRQIIYRLMLAWNVKEMQHLCEFIGGHVRMPSNWITKGGIPWEVVYTCHIETGRSLDWLYNGKQGALEYSPELEKAYGEKVRSLVQAFHRTGLFNTDSKAKEQEVVDIFTREAFDFFSEKQKLESES